MRKTLPLWVVGMLAGCEGGARPGEELLADEELIAEDLLAVPVNPAAPLTFNVTKTSDTFDGSCSARDCSLREAIAAANANPGTDTIRVPAGTYRLTRSGAREDACARGDLDVREAVVISGAGPEVTIIDGNKLDRVFDLRSGRVTLRSVTVRNGYERDAGGGGVRVDPAASLIAESVYILANVTERPDPPPHPFETGRGGAVFGRGSVTLRRVRVRGNLAIGPGEGAVIAASGGGVFMGGRFGGPFPRLVVEDSLFAGNKADSVGGAIAELGETASITIRRTTFDTNKARRKGGAVEVWDAPLSISDSVFSSNWSDGSAGALASTAPTTITRTTFDFNHAEGSGGAAYVSAADISASTFSRNDTSHRDGGALFTSAGTRVVNSTFSANICGQRGGAIFVNPASDGANNAVDIIHSTFFANRAGTCTEEGFCGDAIRANGGVPANLRGSIFAGSDVPLTGNIVGLGTNLSDVIYEDLSGTWIFADAGLGSLASNGGPTRTHALAIGSPALDQAPAADCPAADQRGSARPRDGTGDGLAACDLGAYERWSWRPVVDWPGDPVLELP